MKVKSTWDKLSGIADEAALIAALAQLPNQIDEALQKAKEDGLSEDDAVDVVTEMILDAIFGGSQCLAPGTPVYTPYGKRAIETVNAGDLVRGFDHAAGQWVWRTVLAVHVHQHDGDLHRLTIAGTSIDATPSHPFWVVAGRDLAARPPPSHCEATEPGGRIPGRWVDAKDVRKGDAVLLAGGVVAEVTATSLRPGTGPVYNLTVEGVHNFAAGDAGVLVHNTGGAKGAVGAVFNKKTAAPKVKAATKAGAKKVYGAGGANKVTSPVGDLRDAGKKDAHHVIQDAAVWDLPGYNSDAAPGVQLQGPANLRGTPHHSTRAVQRERGGGTYASERRIGYKALRRAGMSQDDARAAVQEADDYFRSIGVTPNTVTRIPRDRR